LSDGSRRITEISEVTGLDDDGNYQVQQIYAIRNLVRAPDGKLSGQIEPTGVLPTFMQEIEDNRIPFPRTKFMRSAA
jgi:pilus assembly protein CpaF